MGQGEGDEQPALQVIVLGTGGGPLENNTTSFLVRSTSAGWRSRSVLAVDAGVHLSAIVGILEGHASDYSPGNPHKPVTLVDGPFAGLEIPHSSAKANAAHITRTLIGTYLITHPHLDHISGFVVNTAALPGSRPKTLAGLPHTIEAFKNHIFNNVIWPNLSDENNGAGIVTYMRLVEGGSPALGEGDSKGYVEICEGLIVKTLGISHGHCIENHSHRGSNAGIGSTSSQEASPRLRTRTSSQLQNSLRSQRSASAAGLVPADLSRPDLQERKCVYDSAAYFIHDQQTRKEVLIFGDVEPDSISLLPRNQKVWSEAAPKITAGRLNGIFIECSFDDSQTEDRLYGHMAPRFLVEELKVLAREIQKCKEQGTERGTTKKRKRQNNGHTTFREPRNHERETRSSRASTVSPLSQVAPADENHGPIDVAGVSGLTTRKRFNFLLKGVKIVIIHVKDKLTDGPGTEETILKELNGYERDAQLGCEFIIPKAGEAVYL